MDIVSLGELLVEFVKVHRGISHEAPDLYMGPFPSGAPAITIDTASRLGLRAGFIGVVGPDEFGRLIINRFKRDNVDTSMIKVDESAFTGLSFVAYDESGSRRFIFNLKWSASAKLNPGMVDENYVKGARVLHVSGSTMYIAKGPMEACIKAINEAKRGGVLVSFDPNIRVELMDVGQVRETLLNVLKSTDILLAGEDEVKAIVGTDNLKDAVGRLINLGIKIIAVKRGSRGSSAFLKGGRFDEPAYKVNEVDPTGAGDVFNAAFIYGYLKGWDIGQILRFANAAAAVKVSRMGPMEVPNSVEEVLEVMNRGVK